MDLEAIRDFCLRKRGKITESLPFGEDVLVFKVNGKMFLLARLNTHPLSINLKSDPEQAVELRERYESVRPGYHMNKKYWNTVVLDGTIPPNVLYTMIDRSYEHVVMGLGKSVRDRLLKELKSSQKPQ